MRRIKVWMIGVVCFPVAIAVAQTNTTSLEDKPLFRANEASLDAFGTVSVGQQTINHISGDRVRDNGRLGAGLGANYFFTRNIGLEGDAYTENAGHSFVDDASGSLVLRLPLEGIHLAPYIYGGGGRQFDPNEAWFGQAGVGLEVRFTHDFGLFADARYVLPEKIDNFGVFRVGVRLTF